MSVRSPVPSHTRKGDHSDVEKHCSLLKSGSSEVVREGVKAVGSINQKNADFWRKSFSKFHIINL